MEIFFKSFIALFVSIDVIGALPLLLGLTKSLSENARKKLIYRATATALLLGVVFVFAGRKIFDFLGITESDFKVAGGLLLLIFAMRDLLFTDSHQGTSTPTKVGLVPIAIPLMMGPAALTTLMIGSEQFGYLMILSSLVINLLIVLVLFLKSKEVLNWMGDDVSDAFNKVFSLLMAAIGVMFIRSGIFEMIAKVLP
ncbi:MAG: MarC family protein [Bdellovibrionaceae bacterium]|nr:MarC family protein [Pseudobdellovibrionaceae bacterium]NUM57947.1 MarC family protein [Pseudobdellovibrionaceae bacterium]